MDRIEHFPFQTMFPKQTTNTPAEASQAFADMLKGAITAVNDAQIRSSEATEALINGEATDLHNVMIAGEKASLSLTAAIEVRNKAIEAYNQIMRMQI